MNNKNLFFSVQEERRYGGRPGLPPHHHANIQLQEAPVKIYLSTFMIYLAI